LAQSKLKANRKLGLIAKMNGIEFTKEYIEFVKEQFADYTSKMLILIQLGYIKPPTKTGNFENGLLD